MLRSDGTALAFGHNSVGHCDVAQLGPGVTYVANGAMLMVQLLDGHLANNHMVKLRNIATGEALARWTVAEDCGGLLVTWPMREIPTFLS